MSMSFWQKIERPIKVLAPMAGYTDAAFRLLCREYGADVAMTELISADAIAYGKFKVDPSRLRLAEAEKSEFKVGGNTLVFNKVTSKNHNTAEMLSFFEAESPMVIQLFGKFPEKFAKAAQWITEELKPDGIDINMGCPARKVVGSDHGAALLRNHTLAEEIVRAVKENTNLPVSVKTRLGWSEDSEVLEFGPKLIGAGAETITLHGRTYKDGFKGEARWENIFKLKEVLGDRAVVIGNGDVQSISDARFSVSGSIQLDGYAIGRAAFGKPYIFNSQIPAMGTEELKELILKHAELAFAIKEEKGIIEFRKHILRYLRSFQNATDLRIEAVQIKSVDDVRRIIGKIID